MILAGDIGGTKTVLAVFSQKEGDNGKPQCETRYASSNYGSLEDIVREFLHQTGTKPTVASFGVAGPVQRGQARITNLPWIVNAENMRTAFGFSRVFLLNDLEAVAVAVPSLEDKDLETLNRGEWVAGGNIAVAAPGTGLGTSFLVWTGSEYKACASEGGHVSFAPTTPLQVELLHYLMTRYEHVSFERVCSGGSLPNIYDFFLERKNYPQPDQLREELEAADDRTPIIIRHGLARKTDICTATLDMFIQILGTVIGNMAVSLLPTGGIFLGGGIPPRILDRLRGHDFMEAVTRKGRYADLCARMPIHVILDAGTPLHGAFRYGLQAVNGGGGVTGRAGSGDVNSWKCDQYLCQKRTGRSGG